MRKIYQILNELKIKSVQHYLDEAEEMTQRLVEFIREMPETPPNFEGSRILLLMLGTPRCLYAALHALYFAYHFKADLNVLHKGVLEPMVVEKARELQVTIALTRRIDHIQWEELKYIVKKQLINLIVTSAGIPYPKKLLSQLSVSILFTN